MKHRILALAAILPALNFLTLTEAPAFSINVSPPSIRLSIPPGETKSGTITVENKSDDPIDMRAYIEDWSYGSDGGKQFVQAGTLPFSCAKWITTRPQKFRIEPKSNVGVQYTISMPPDAEGGRYAVVFFESIVGGDEAAKGNVMLHFAGRIGTIIYLEAEGKVKKAGSITAFTCGRPDQNSPLAINITLKNEGNTYLIAEGVMNIIDKEGNIFGRKELGPINTLQGESADYKAEWLGDLKEGTYDVIATFSTGLDSPIVAETTLTVASSGTIDKFDIDTAAGQPVFILLVNNSGNLNAKAEGAIEVLDENGRAAASIPLKSVLIAPNSKKEIQVKSDTAFTPGKYRAKAAIMLGAVQLTKEGEFSIK